MTGTSGSGAASPDGREVEAVDAVSFKQAFRRFPAGCAIVTGLSDGRPIGILVSSLTSVSAEPAIVVMSVSDDSYAGRAVLGEGGVVVHLLTAPDQPLAEVFAQRSSSRDGVAWGTDTHGRPTLPTHGPRLGGRVLATARAGSAILVTIGIDEVAPADELAEDALVHFDRHWFNLPRP